MASTVIDSLLVTLGMDPSGYKKGAAEAEKSQKQFRESTKKTGDEISASLYKIGKDVAGMFLAFEGVKDTLKFFGGLNTELADLGRLSKNIGMSAHDVNGWGMAVELAGGKAADAQADLAKLQNDIVNFKTKGEISPLLLLMQRTGVAITDASGKTRNLTDIYKDLGDVLRVTDQATAHTWASQAGLSDSTFNLIAMEARARQDLIDKAEANNKVTDAGVARAAEIEAKWRQIGQNIKGAAVELYEEFEPAVSAILGVVTKIGTVFKDLIQLIINGWRMIANLVSGIKLPGGGTVGGFMSYLFGEHIPGLVKSSGLDVVGGLNAGVARSGGTPGATMPTAIGPGPQPTGALTGSKGARNNNPGNLRWAGQTGAIGRDKEGFAIFRTWEDGVAAARRQITLDASRGMTSVSSIISSWAPANENNTGAYIADVAKRLGVGANDKLSPAQFNALASAIFVHEGSMAAGNFAANAASGVSSPAVAGKGARSSETNVEVGQVIVHTQATDADGMAAAAAGALKRKISTSQVNSGMS